MWCNPAVGNEQFSSIWWMISSFAPNRIISIQWYLVLDDNTVILQWYYNYNDNSFMKWYKIIALLLKLFQKHAIESMLNKYSNWSTIFAQFWCTNWFYCIFVGIEFVSMHKHPKIPWNLIALKCAPALESFLCVDLSHTSSSRWHDFISKDKYNVVLLVKLEDKL